MLTEYGKQGPDANLVYYGLISDKVNIMTINRITRMLAFVAILLLIPLVAMQFTSEVNWSTGDFVAAGVLLFGLGLVLDFVKHKVNNRVHRIIAGIIIVLLFLLLWMDLAVGLFGAPWSGS